VVVVFIPRFDHEVYVGSGWERRDGAYLLYVYGYVLIRMSKNGAICFSLCVCVCHLFVVILVKVRGTVR
jgi:hypothetical protein